MRLARLHRWDLTPKEAIALQATLAARVQLTPLLLDGLRTVAGADCAFDKERGEAIAAVVVFSFPSLVEIERCSARAPLSFPYVPGLLTFREGPALLAAFAKLTTAPDAVLLDGQGIAHPRRMGLASHMGLWLGVPTIGCAKSRLCGECAEPAAAFGDWTPLVMRAGDASRGTPFDASSRATECARGKVLIAAMPQTGVAGGRTRPHEIVGACLRTRHGVRPIFVSPGHRCDLASAIAITLACCDGVRIPKPTRVADHLVSELKRRRLGLRIEN